MSLGEMPLVGFGEALASAAPTPGGGCASALSGALAAGLVAMVARTTVERGEEMAGVAAEADGLRAEFLRLVDEDARAFDRVVSAFRMPKRTAEERAVRAGAIQEGYRGAVGPPMLVCTRSLRVLELALRVAEDGNPNAVSDAGVAALLAAAALRGGALNVRINLGSIDDEEFRTAHAQSVQSAESRGETLRDRALAAAQKNLD